MTATAKSKSSVVSIEALLGQQGEVFKRLLKESLQEVLEAERSVNRAWDGARRHPYTDIQLAAVAGGTVAPASCRNGDSTAYSLEDFAPLLREPISIELASRRGASARGVVSTRAYREALRRDLKDVLLPELRRRPRQQLRQVLGPDEVFEFDALIELFAVRLSQPRP